VDDEGLHIKVNDKVEVLKVDHVIVCAGQDPLKELLKPLQSSGVSTFLIGGAEAATELDAKRAIDQVNSAYIYMHICKYSTYMPLKTNLYLQSIVSKTLF
jgi:hypothetical protein